MKSKIAIMVVLLATLFAFVFVIYTNENHPRAGQVSQECNIKGYQC